MHRPVESNLNPPDPSRMALDYLHGLLQRPAREQPDLERLLAELAQAFGVPAAGLVGLPEGAPLLRHPGPVPGPWPWQEDPELLNRVGRSPSALTVLRPGGGSLLIAPVVWTDGSAWLLWLEDNRSTWDDRECAALLLAAGVLAQQARAVAPPPWAQTLDRAARQQRLETTASVTRRLAHDFGNVLTGILGFTELALAQQVPANTPLHSYLNEVYRAAQGGAHFTQQLRLFSRRQSSSSRSTALLPVLLEEAGRVRGTLSTGQHLQVSVPDDLPPIALDADVLRQIAGALLDNAREALVGPGSITLSARLAELSRGDANELYGSVRPGPHVEVCLADTGTGLSPEAERRLFAEPFFTTKPRRRGFGLAVAYGLLHAHQGGIRLYPTERGVVARFVVPVAARPAGHEINPSASVADLAHGSAGASPSPGVSLSQGVSPSRAALRGEKVLVVDDDPLVLEYVTTTLERAGYRVQPASSGEEALRLYFAQPGDPFRLVLSDVVMPKFSGVDLAGRLAKRDGNARVLLMSGQVPADYVRSEIAHQFELLAKPFSPEGLLRAVRLALDRPAPRRTAPTGAAAEGAIVPSSR
jgi:signal transduction histidine kinase/CheY-like chemotaxis protein